MGPLVSLGELFGGAALVLGLATRVAGAGMALTMLGAIVFAHLGAGFFAPAGFEFPLMLLAASAALVLTGAGEWSVDAVLERRLRPSAAASGSAAVARSAHVRAA
jgi:putative oxidoreductase